MSEQVQTQAHSTLDKYELVGLSGKCGSFLSFMKRKYPKYNIKPYGSSLLTLFTSTEMTKERYIQLIESGDWVAVEMAASYEAGWGEFVLFTDVFTPQIAEEIKKAGGLLIRFDDFDWYDDPTGIDMYRGFDVSIHYERTYYDDEANERILTEINKRIAATK